MPAWIGPALQIGGGIAQALIGGSRAKKAQRELESMQVPVYQGGQGITDFYNKALSRYNTNPYNTSFYNQQSQNIGRNTAASLNSIQDRRGGVNSVARTLALSNDASLNAATAAEQQQAQALGQLGQAAGMQGDLENMQYQYNKLYPFERRSGLLSAKAAAGSATMNTGLSNIFGGAQNWSNMLMKMGEVASGGVTGAAK